MRLHRHDWQHVAEEFNPPAQLRTLKNASERTGARVIHGFTVVTYGCSRCPAQKYTEVIGKTAGAA